ncbi:IclR family transcriptional regulator [Caldimonas thermodepolymerans]|jgi:Transcriptional regulator|nr:IclR family transcriptional regulator [Caldimonas thermodepolymerans]RDH99791.1 IclR family transcriptional regulator [Caldimonas thermodepolymerans]
MSQSTVTAMPASPVSSMPSGDAGRDRHPPAGLVPAVVRAFAVLDLLAGEREPIGLSRIASSLALPKSSVHALCRTMAQLGYLRRYEDGSYFIGARVLGLAHAFSAHTQVVDEFHRIWSELGQRPEETIILSVLDGADIVYVAARPGSHPLGLAFHVGMRLPAHLAATGKSMLAFHEPAAVRERLPALLHPMVQGRQPVPIDVFLQEMAETRARGYSIDDEGVREGIYCYGAPVFGAAGLPVAGVGVCIPKALLPSSGERLRGVVMRVARQLSERIGGRVAPAAFPGSTS